MANKAQGRRGRKKAPYYKRFAELLPGKKIRRKANREKRLAAVKAHPEIGSPSQLKERKKRGLVPKQHELTNPQPRKIREEAAS